MDRKDDDNKKLKNRIRKLQKDNNRLKSELATLQKAFDKSIDRIKALTEHKSLGILMEELKNEEEN